MSHSCPNLVSTSFLYNPYPITIIIIVSIIIYIYFLISRNVLFTSLCFFTIVINIFSFNNHSNIYNILIMCHSCPNLVSTSFLYIQSISLFSFPSLVTFF